jgi:ornithine cyclodeaminase
MLMLDAETIMNQLSYPTLVDQLRLMHLGPKALHSDLLMESTDASDITNHFFVRAGWQPGQAIGAKIVSIFPGNNQARAWPSIQAVYVLFDGRNGTPVACLDGTAITYLKTATDSALGARLLAREGISSMLMIGAGEMARHLITAHCAIHPSIERVYVWNRTPAKAEQLCQGELPKQFGQVAFSAVEDLAQYAAKVDLISSATATTTPLIKGEWLQKGTHVDLVGAFTAEMREADDECLRRASLFVDARETTIEHIGELMIPIAKSVIKADDIRADLADLCQNRHPGRSSADEITLYKNGGGGHLDLMLARIMVKHCQLKQEQEL